MAMVSVVAATTPTGPVVYFTETSATGIGTGFLPTDGAIGTGDFFYLTLDNGNTYERWNPPFASLTGDADYWTITPRAGEGGESQGKTYGEGVIGSVVSAGFNTAPSYTDVSPFQDWPTINGSPPPP